MLPALLPDRSDALDRPDSPRPPRLSTVVDALRARRLDRTLTSALPHVSPHDNLAVGPTGLSELDARLGGGLPRGHLSEIAGPQSSGRTSLMLHAIAAATSRGELVALVDALDMLDPLSAEAAGVDCSRLLWIRGHVVTNPGACRDLNQRAMEQAVKALGLVLQAGNFGLVVLDFGEAPADAVRRLPFTTWLRLHRMVEGSQTVGLLVHQEPVSRSAAGLTIRLQPARTEPRRPGRFGARLFEGLDLQAQIARARLQRHDSMPLPIATRVACHV